jgi:hypothetical protein
VVIVGEEKKRCIIHTFAVKTSGYFKTALNGNWRESKDREFTLPEFKPEIFEIYAQWLYTGRVLLSGTASSEDLNYKATLSLTRLVKLYILGLFLLDTTFQNAVTDKLLETVEETSAIPGVSASAKTWPKLPDASPLRRMLVRFWAQNMSVNEVVEADKHLPRDMVVCIMKDLVEIREDHEAVKKKIWNPSYKYRCDYHIHDETAPKGPQCDPHVPNPRAKAD